MATRKKTATKQTPSTGVTAATPPKPATRPTLDTTKPLPSLLSFTMPGANEMREALDKDFGPVAQMVAHHEGLRTTLYEDRTRTGESKGHAIGVGRNLNTRGVSVAEALLLFYNDLRQWTDEVRKHVPEYAGLDGVRQAVLIDMAHTMSANGLARFKGMRRAIAEQNWARAVYEMGDSLWYEQQPRSRSCLLLTMMLTGRDGKDFDIDDRDQQEEFAATDRGRYQAALDLGVPGVPVMIAAKYMPQKPKRPSSGGAVT